MNKPIEIRNVSKAYDNRMVLKDLSLILEPGRIYAIMGPSGSGKTTLLNLLLGLEKPDKGEILSVPDKTAVVFQEDRLCESFSVLFNVRLVSEQKKTAAEETARQLLAELGLKGEEKRPVRSLSGGMKRRVAIARALEAESDYLILDEPFKGLDSETREQTIRVLLKHQQGRGILLITHDRTEAERMGAVIYSLPDLSGRNG